MFLGWFHVVPTFIWPFDRIWGGSMCFWGVSAVVPCGSIRFHVLVRKSTKKTFIKHLNKAFRNEGELIDKIKKIKQVWKKWASNKTEIS